MKEEEYKTSVNAITELFQKSLSDLNILYAQEQRKFGLGDIISRHGVIVLIERITAYKGIGLPGPVYYGSELKKDLTKRKDGNKTSIYGNEGVVLLQVKEHSNHL